MSGALGGLTDSLRRNYFCIGIGGDRGKRYVCSGEADENAIDKAVDLLVEAVRRMLRWRAWETQWIDEIMDEWLEKRDRLEVQLRGRYSEDVVKAITGLIDGLISYTEELQRHWRNVSSEVKRLIEDLMSGKAEIIIWSNEKGVSTCV